MQNLELQLRLAEAAKPRSVHRTSVDAGSRYGPLVCVSSSTGRALKPIERRLNLSCKTLSCCCGLSRRPSRDPFARTSVDAEKHHGPQVCALSTTRNVWI
jgi:hypothetical protein